MFLLWPLVNIAKLIRRGPYQYGFPLYPFRNPTIQTILQANGTNRFYHGRQLADSSFTQVVSPNVDTLYSSAVLDLSQDDIILEIPEVNDRYYVYAIYDV